MPHQPFNYHSADELHNACTRLGIALPWDENLSLLQRPGHFGALPVANRLVIHPMEGCDGEHDGRPGPLTLRRYQRFAAGGAGLIWVEACAVVPEGRANPRQLWLTDENVATFAEMVKQIHAVAQQHDGSAHRPVLVLQLTHAGRYSKPEGVPAPLITHHSLIDATSMVTAETPLVSDEYLDQLQEAFVTSALLAQQAGFDAVDIKACHRYLISELLASFLREDSNYGGSYENRTRFLREVLTKIRGAAPSLTVTSRMNVYDALPYPYGWGVKQGEDLQPALSEPKALLEDLINLGLTGANVTAGNPYYHPFYNRPFDRPTQGAATAPEHPLQSVLRLLQLAGEIQQTFPAFPVVATGLSWLRQFFPYVAAGLLRQEWATFIGMGREAFAYPDFPRDLREHGQLNAAHCCIACSACSQMMRDGVQSGCIIHDCEVYGPIYREGRRGRS